jgi:hypothetical protein
MSNTIIVQKGLAKFRPYVLRPYVLRPDVFRHYALILSKQTLLECPFNNKDHIIKVAYPYNVHRLMPIEYLF